MVYFVLGLVYAESDIYFEVKTIFLLTVKEWTVLKGQFHV